MKVYVANKPITLKPAKSIGKGGEADVYDIGKGKALKVFKSPDHPDYQGLPHEQQGARERIQIHQEKLRAFPQNLPPQVITPDELATDKSGQQIVGYTMRYLQEAEVLVRYTDRTFRQAGVSHQAIIDIFRDLHETVQKIHQARVVIGDFNDLNVLILDDKAYLIDADSFQFGQFLCPVFTTRFVDPLLCSNGNLMMSKPHNPNSDWYAFTVMLMECLLFVEPYGGIYRPQNKKKRIPQQERPHHRITVFHPEVRYPKPAIPYHVLPDDLLHHFQQVFEKDERGQFPLLLLDHLRWTTCTACGTEHARSVCPNCAQAAPAAIKSVTIIRGQVKATRLFRTNGQILTAANHAHKLIWLYHENDQFKRENGTTILNGQLDPYMQFRLRGQKTLIGYQNVLITLIASQPSERSGMECFDANPQHHYWINGGQLWRDGQFGSVQIGEVLPRQTRFWVGSEFGFGFYRAGNLSVAFVFDVEQRGLNDQVQLPHLQGQLIHAICFFSAQKCWLLATTQETVLQGSKPCRRLISHCFVIRRDGSLEAEEHIDANHDHWLAHAYPPLGSEGGLLGVGNGVLAATDEGIIRLETDHGRIVKTKEFPDTEPFVYRGCRLLAGTEGLYVVTSNEINLLKIN